MNEAQAPLDGPDFTKGVPLPELADGAMLLTRACAGSSSLDRAHQSAEVTPRDARSYAHVNALNHERAGCARSNDPDLAAPRTGKACPLRTTRKRSCSTQKLTRFDAV